VSELLSRTASSDPMAAGARRQCGRRRLISDSQVPTRIPLLLLGGAELLGALIVRQWSMSVG
jgi:hypothetical protein